MMQAHTNAQLESDDIKASASGRWPEIIAALAGVDQAILDGRHHPCPKKCNPDQGGKDRFRLASDVDGWLHCNQCFYEKNGDGISALRWLNGWDFPTAIKNVAEYLNLKPGQSAVTPVVTENRVKSALATKGEPSNFSEMMSMIDPRTDGPLVAMLLADFCAAMPPITPEAVTAAGGELVIWPKSQQHGQHCSVPGLCSAGYRERLDSAAMRRQ